MLTKTSQYVPFSHSPSREAPSSHVYTNAPTRASTPTRAANHYRDDAGSRTGSAGKLTPTASNAILRHPTNATPGQAAHHPPKCSSQRGRSLATGSQSGLGSIGLCTAFSRLSFRFALASTTGCLSHIRVCAAGSHSSRRLPAPPSIPPPPHNLSASASVPALRRRALVCAVASPCWVTRLVAFCWLSQDWVLAAGSHSSPGLPAPPSIPTPPSVFGSLQ